VNRLTTHIGGTICITIDVANHGTDDTNAASGAVSMIADANGAASGAVSMIADANGAASGAVAQIAGAVNTFALMFPLDD